MTGQNVIRAHSLLRLHSAPLKSRSRDQLGAQCRVKADAVVPCCQELGSDPGRQRTDELSSIDSIDSSIYQAPQNYLREQKNIRRNIMKAHSFA
jgi:hypothetical protein